MEMVYDYPQRKTTKQEIESQIKKTIAESVAYAKESKAKASEDSDDDDHYDGMMGVATAADRMVREEKKMCSVTQDFGCHKCFRVVKATAAAPEKIHVTVEHWHGWSDPMRGPEKWEEISLCCMDCAAPDLADAAEQRKRTRERNEERASDQSKRLKASDDSDGFVAKVRNLKIPQLGALCEANAVLKTGKKEQLIERLVGVWRYGSLESCPACKSSSFELQYKSGSLNPSEIRCKHMRGKGRPCGFRKSLSEVVMMPLRDTVAHDLLSVGITPES
eukprot:gnl/TRDRNA2_/TRDRNA2_183394_c0_seq1.p1 gnl/TRDRNA2_/TRDRNA2_183394_c0~~gnl/TRDRNA2_/TRDRNA2_183394_c0_seq1.p1  ORF type:complete len:276 (-),score=73.17 gnl/TRDRNA2_/TRDRNA2_183394_c0_seq1:193-1020(-)